ncbi:hypothetical protein [Streptomyces sp. NPDC003393]
MHDTDPVHLAVLGERVHHEPVGQSARDPLVDARRRLGRLQGAAQLGTGVNEEPEPFHRRHVPVGSRELKAVSDAASGVRG